MKSLSKHPCIRNNQDIIEVCRPLDALDISYFAHVRVNQHREFSAICRHPDFLEHYIKKRYYNADIHTAGSSTFGKYVIWENIERCGNSEKLYIEGKDFGIQNTFTIIKEDNGVSNCYHFATHHDSRQFNQVYLNNLDQLEKFILQFNHQVQTSDLRKAYEFTYGIDDKNYGYTTKNKLILPVNQQDGIDNALFCVPTQAQRLGQLSTQQRNCMQLMLRGYSHKCIADKLNLSARTVSHYIEAVRKKLGCKNSKELFLWYYSQA